MCLRKLYTSQHLMGSNFGPFMFARRGILCTSIYGHAAWHESTQHDRIWGTDDLFHVFCVRPVGGTDHETTMGEALYPGQTPTLGSQSPDTAAGRFRTRVTPPAKLISFSMGSERARDASDARRRRRRARSCEQCLRWAARNPAVGLPAFGVRCATQRLMQPSCANKETCIIHLVARDRTT